MLNTLKHKLKKLDKFCYKHLKNLVIGSFLIGTIPSILREGITKGHIVVWGLIAIYFLSNYVQKKLNSYKANRLIRENRK